MLSPTRTRRLLLLTCLFLFALAIRTFRAVQEPIINTDAIRYIKQAQLLPTDPVAALRGEVYHPLHSAAALAAHALIHNFFQNDRTAWLASVKLVGILAGSILALQIVALARLCGAPFWCALAAALVWILGRRTSVYGADGLSDTLALSLLAASIITALHALRFKNRFLTPFFISGLFAGLAYLARPEGLFASVLMLITIFILALPRRINPPPIKNQKSKIENRLKFLPRRPLPLRRALAAALCLILGTAIPALPYMLVIGSLSRKETKLVIPESGAPLPYTLLSATGKILKELWETFGFSPLLILIVTFLVSIVLAKRLWLRPRLRLPMLLWIILWIAIMFVVILRLGYLDGRHTLILVLLLHALLGLSFLATARAARYWLPRPLAHLPVAIVFLAILPGITQLAVAPRGDKRYIKSAADWIAQNIPQDTVVCDAEQLVGYYSNHPYAQWLGSPDSPHLESLDSIITPTHPRLLLAYRYQATDHAPPSIGPYQSLISFPSPGTHEGLTLYCVPANAIMSPR